MSSIKYSIDRINIIKSKDEAILFIKGWAIGQNIIRIKIYADKTQIYDREVDLCRVDVEKAFKEAQDKKSGFDIKLMIPQKYKDNIQLKIIFEDNKETETIHYSMKQIMSQEQQRILYNIDNVIHEFNKVIIRGWAFSTHNSQVNIKINPKVKSNIKLHLIRSDVKNAFSIYPWSVNSGFEIVLEDINSIKKIQLQFSDDKLIEKATIDISNSKLNKIIKQINKANFNKGFIYLKKHGIKQFTIKAKEKLLYSDNYFKNPEPSKNELEVQRKTKFNYNPLISIIVPLYNTPKQFLVEMVESVINQTYSNWELCTVDASDQQNEKVAITMRTYVEQDKRIKYKRLNDNYGIAENTNKAIAISKGDYILLFDHDDLLTPNALFEIVKVINKNKKVDFIYTDEANVYEDGKTLTNPHFKPDWSPYTLRSYNYITHISVFKRELMEKVGFFRPEYDGSQDHDMILRLTESATCIKHISKVLYYWRIHSGSVASGIEAKEYALEAGRKAIQAQLDRQHIKGEVVSGLYPCTYKVNYEIIDTPLVSIIIPNKDSKEILSVCIESILKKSTYKNYEVIIVENNSETREIFDYYKTLEEYDKIKIVYWKDKFNYSAINNYGVQYSKGDYILLLNNDIEVITPNWIEEMLMLCQQKDVGAVGAKLYFEDDTIQHAGVILGIGGIAGHSHKGFPRESRGYVGRLQVVQNLSAVTAACLMCKREIYEELKGLDEKFEVALNDVDFCMRIRKLGYYILYTPFCELYHYESKTRGYEDTPEKKKRFERERQYFFSKWGDKIEDPYYNENLTLEREDFSLKQFI